MSYKLSIILKNIIELGGGTPRNSQELRSDRRGTELRGGNGTGVLTNKNGAAINHGGYLSRKWI